MKPLLVGQFILLIAALGNGPPSTQQATNTKSVATQPTVTPSIRRLIDQLGSPDYRRRESAQHQLAALGDAAMPALIERLTDPNPEIASRVAALVGTPRDPAMTVEAALRLLLSTDPDWMERGVHLLFRSPTELYEPFAARIGSAPADRREMLKVVSEQLRQTKFRWDQFEKRYAKIKLQRPAVAERERAMQLETNMYDAEAAFWGASDLLEDQLEKKAVESAASAPASP